EQAIHQDGSTHARREPAGQRGAARESAHVGGEHGRDGQLGRAEDGAELARPRRLVEQRREARREEAREQGGPARRSAVVHRPAAGSAFATTSVSASAIRRWPNAFGWQWSGRKASRNGRASSSASP